MKQQAFLLLLIILLSCGKSGNEKKDNEDIISTVNGKFENGVIRYNNALVDFMNNSGVQINKVTKDFTTIATMVGSERKTEFEGNAFSGSQVQNEYETILIKGTGLPLVNQSEIVDKVKAINKAYSNVREAYTMFISYIQKEGFNNDDWAKGKALVSILEKNITAYYEHGEAAYTLMRPLTDEDEIELLENHPLKEAMIATKLDFRKSENILRLISEETIDIEEINEIYENLESSIRKNKSASKEVLKENNKEQHYNNFYNNIESFLAEIQNGKADGKFTLIETKRAQEKYKNLINSYNDFEVYLAK